MRLSQKIEKLKELYPRVSMRDLLDVFPNRIKEAMELKAARAHTERFTNIS